MFAPKVILKMFTASCKKRTKSSVLLAIIAMGTLSTACRLSGENISYYFIQAANAEVQSNISVPGVKNFKEIKFEVIPKGKYIGYFDGINYSTNRIHTLPKNKTFRVNGWALTADSKQPANLVLITMGSSHNPIAVASVNKNRPDIIKLFKNPALAKSGWEADIVPSSFLLSSSPNEKVILKAWSYNPQTKVATLLANSNTHEIIFK
jgi:hypothetical protein